jgi:hypothetical protein
MSVSSLDTNLLEVGSVSVKLPDRFKTREEIERALGANRERIEAAAVELEAAREVLRTLLAHGRALSVPVAVMARAAGISRETAHKFLREERRQARARRTDG